MPNALLLQHLVVKNECVDSVARVLRVCPHLENFDIDRRRTEMFEDVIEWPPLHTFRHKYALFTTPKALLAIERNHLPCLERLILERVFDEDSWPQLNFEGQAERGHGHRLRELQVSPLMLRDHMASLASLRFLRCLRLVNDYPTWNETACGQLHDASPLASLPLLEELAFDLSTTATNCRALRALTHLRILDMMDGWFRDFLEYTPRLESIHCSERFTDRQEHRTFQARDDSDVAPPRLKWLHDVTIGSDV